MSGDSTERQTERRAHPRTGAVLPSDHAGAETLEILAEAPQYNRWQFDMVAPWLGRRILEVGAGIGNMSEQFLEGRPDLLVITDTDAFYRTRLAERFAGRAEVVVEALSMPDLSAGPRFAEYRLDTVIATNVVEHIEDDLGTVRTMRSLLVSGPSSWSRPFNPSTAHWIASWATSAATGRPGSASCWSAPASWWSSSAGSTGWGCSAGGSTAGFAG